MTSHDDPARWGTWPAVNQSPGEAATVIPPQAVTPGAPMRADQRAALNRAIASATDAIGAAEYAGVDEGTIADLAVVIMRLVRRAGSGGQS